MTLKINAITAGYGSRMILNDLSLTVAPGDRIALIGHNGAGKSTILKAITGEIRPRGGDITMDDVRIDRFAIEQRVRRGISQVPAGRHVFPQLSVEKNLRVGAYTRSDQSGIDEDVALYFEKFPVLGKKARRPAGTLSGGEQQQLAIARALMARPRILLVDEPSLGLSPLMVEEVFAHLGALRDSNVSIILAEQNVRMALKITDRAIVLSQGAIQTEMGADDLMNNAAFRKTYLGG